MSNLSNSDKQKIEALFDMKNGYVLDFSNATFQDFIKTSVGIDVYQDKYYTYGESKAKIMRSFWDTEDDQIIGKVLIEMIDRWRTNKLINDDEITNNQQKLYDDCLVIVKSLVNKQKNEQTIALDTIVTPKYVKKVFIKNLNNLDVFMASKKMCQYIMQTAWNVSVGTDEIDAEYNLAIAQSKRYKEEIKKIAALDTDLSWGTVKLKPSSDSFMITKKGDFNPWYDGNLTLNELLESLELLVEFTNNIQPVDIYETEFIHYYYFLHSKIPDHLPKPIVIDFQSLHPKIKEHCESLYNTKHYSDAILTAYKVVINEIKLVSKINNLDGKQLIDKSFSLENPIIKLNSLQTMSERDEQIGFMFLFSGAAIGIRNPKAHDLVVQTDKLRTLQYLSFASLLLQRLCERIYP